MTLRARLLVALLAMALLPIAAFTVFTLDQLDRATQRWFRPGVEHALDSALEVSRTSLGRIEAICRGCAEQWAPLAAHGRLSSEDREGLRDALAALRLDFVQIYRRAPDGWHLEEQIVPRNVLMPLEPDLGERLGAAVESDYVVRSELGALAGVALADENTALLAGLWVAPDFFNQRADIGEGVARYRQLGIIVPIQRRYVWLLVGALVLSLTVLALLFADRIAHGLARPLRDLAAAIGLVAGGDLRARVEPAGASEMRTLATSFNEMAGRLATARESLQRAEREAAWRDVARHLAHEIKNPLTAMRYALHRIQRRVERVPESDRTAVAESVEAILREVQDLSAMAEQFALHARRPEPRREAEDLAEIARGAAALQEPEALSVGDPDARLPVIGDRVLLSRAVQNLIVNAREASPPGTAVEVRLRREPGRACVDVLDRGPGLPAGPVERLFEPYVSTKNRGSGLGLSLVRDVAQAHGGGITLENREGGGAEARFWVPLAGSHGKEPA